MIKKLENLKKIILKQQYSFHKILNLKRSVEKCIEEKFFYLKRILLDKRSCYVNYYIQGRLSYKKGKMLEAVQNFKKALEKEKETSNIYWLGLSYGKLGNPQEGLNIFEKALSLRPADPVLWKLKGEQVLEMGRISEAIECFQKALLIEPGDADSWNNKGYCYQIEGDISKAIECYENAYRLNPKSPEIMTNLALCYKSVEDREKAIFYLEKALTYMNDDAGLLNNLGVCWAEKGKNDKALFYFRRALKVQEDNIEIISNMASSLFAAGKCLEALDLYERALSLNIDDHIIWNNVGVDLENRFKYLPALWCYNRALKLKPGWVPALENKAGCLAQLKRFPEALDCVEKLKEQYTGELNERLWKLQAFIYERMGEYETALVFYNKGLGFN